MRKILSCVLLLAMFVSLSNAARATEVSSIINGSDVQSATGELIYNLESQYCIEIPARLYVTDGDYRLTAQYVYLNDTEQVSVYISPMKEPGFITLDNANGDTLDLCVYYVSDIENEIYLSQDGLVGKFTDSSAPIGWMRFAARNDGNDRSAGEYSGSFEFTIQVEARE